MVAKTSVQPPATAPRSIPATSGALRLTSQPTSTAIAAQAAIHVQRATT